MYHTPLQLFFGPLGDKTCLKDFGNNKGADQPGHPRLYYSLIESIISRLATSKISIFKLVSVAEQACLNLTLSDTPKTDFVAMRPIFIQKTLDILKWTLGSQWRMQSSSFMYISPMKQSCIFAFHQKKYVLQ